MVDTSVTADEIEAEFGAEVASLVGEFTDDKSWTKVQAKQMQISSAATKSPKARLIALADKLESVCDMREFPRTGWSQAKIQGFFVWAKAEVAQLQGTNEALERAVRAEFSSTFSLADGSIVPCVPDGDQGEQLRQYYELLLVESLKTQ